MFKDLPEGQTHSFQLDLCKKCGVMTNHIGDTCMKCFDLYTCQKCGRKLSPWINPDTGKMEKYSWYCYKCKGKMVLSIG